VRKHLTVSIDYLVDLVVANASIFLGNIFFLESEDSEVGGIL
jgi:hypothetical protein